MRRSLPVRLGASLSLGGLAMTAAVHDRPLSILLFCDDDPNHASMILDHIAALVTRSRHAVFLFDSVHHPGDEGLDLDEFDVVVIHYSLFVAGDHYLSPVFRRKIRDFHGLKIQFIQDDYRSVDALTREMRFMGIDVLFTLVPEREYDRIWTSRLPGVELVTWIAGYVPDRLVGRPVPALKDRPIEVGYRGRAMPFWLGALAREKVWVGEGFLQHAAKYALQCDISWREEDRLYGRAWDQFNTRCRTMLGCGSGATIADWDGSCERAVRAYLSAHPGALFEEVAEQVLRPWEGNLNLNVISARHFEAIAARTALILFPGEYSGILRPGVHYIPLAKDFCNIDEVVARIRDVRFLEGLATRAYNDVIASGRYSETTFMQYFDDFVARRRNPGHRAIPTKRAYYHVRRNLRQRIMAFGSRATNTVALGQPLRLSFRYGQGRIIQTLPCYGLQRLAFGLLRKVWRCFRAVRARVAPPRANTAPPGAAKPLAPQHVFHGETR